MITPSLLRTQDGVVSRTQLFAEGLAPHDIRRLVRRRDLTPVHPGVLVNHTGVPTWRQRAWAAVLHAAPAALWGRSALPDATSLPRKASIQVAVDASRRIRSLPGVDVRRVRDLDRLVNWSASPPRVRVEVALLTVADAARTEVDAVAVLADAVQARHTTAQRLRDATNDLSRLVHRRLLSEVIDDIAQGTGSVLEQRYLTMVERTHGLPAGERQASVTGLRAVHDVLYGPYRVIVELDGRAHHSRVGDRFADLERDVSTLRAGYVTVRLSWGQVVGQPCRTAAGVAALLNQRGWPGRPRLCPRC